jgi:hypothetical protein
MSMIYCLIERRNKIDPEWELLARAICSDIQETEDLLASYLEGKFDIYEYRIRQCSQVEFYQASGGLILRSPTITNSVL